MATTPARGRIVTVVGATGRLGVHCVDALVRAGHDVRALSRNGARLAGLPARASGLVGDLDDPATLPPAFEAASAAMIITTNGPRETSQGLAAVAAARAAGVTRVAYLSLPAGAPHYGVKRPVEDALRESGLETCILRSNYFFQTDLGMRAAIEQGTYPLPIGTAGVSRVDCRDIADVAAAILADGREPPAELDLSGPEPLSGPAVAECWSRATARPVRYVGDDLDAWCDSLAGVPHALRVQMRALMEFFQRGEAVASAENVSRLERILRRPMRRFEAFVSEAATTWGVVP